MLAAVENHAADRAYDETKADDADQRVRHEEPAAEPRLGREVAEAYCEQGDVGPVHRVEIVPALDHGEDESAQEQVGEEDDGLEHESPLAHRQFKILVVVAGQRSPGGNGHEGRDDEVQDRSVQTVVKGLRPNVLDLGLQEQGSASCGAQRYEADGRYVPADDGDGLGDRKPHPLGHVEQEEGIRNQGYN